MSNKLEKFQPPEQINLENFHPMPDSTEPQFHSLQEGCEQAGIECDSIRFKNFKQPRQNTKGILGVYYFDQPIDNTELVQNKLAEKGFIPGDVWDLLEATIRLKNNFKKEFIVSCSKIQGRDNKETVYIHGSNLTGIRQLTAVSLNYLKGNRIGFIVRKVRE